MSDSFDGFIKRPGDGEVEEAIRRHCAKYGRDPLDAIKAFPVLARRQWLKRFMAHSDLFKLTIDLPGDIAELGVFRGFDLLTWANLLEAYAIGNRTKTVWGFDNFEGFTSIDAQDGPPDPAMQRVPGGYSPRAHREELLDAIAIFDSDRFIPQKPRIRLVEGDIALTVPRFVEANPGVRFSLVHFDCDLYAPTRAALEPLWGSLVPGGLMLFDEYAIKEWPGESRAVDEFLTAHPGLRLKTLSWTNAPAAYLVKP